MCFGSQRAIGGEEWLCSQGFATTQTVSTALLSSQTPASFRRQVLPGFDLVWVLPEDNGHNAERRINST